MCESISLIYFDKIIIYYTTYTTSSALTTAVANKTNIQTVYYCYLFRDQKRGRLNTVLCMKTVKDHKS